MPYIFLSIIAVVGLSGVIAQVVILRELLVSFHGNELNLGVILANWVILEASGVFIFGKIIDRIKQKIDVFIGLEIIFALSLPLSVYLARTFKSTLGIPFGEVVGLSSVFWASFLVILPLGFCHGALFSVGCRTASLFIPDKTASIGKVYSWETLGSIAGGLVLTYLFLPLFNSFQVAFIISAINLVIAVVLLKYSANKRLRYANFFFIALASLSIILAGPAYLQRVSLNRQWQGLKILDYRNSVYGNILVTKKEAQYTFFYNGTPVITTPYPDITFVEEFGNLPLFFHPDPKDILVINSGCGGLINELLKHQIKKIDYAELDPLIIRMLQKFPTDLTRREIQDSRVNIINTDGRFFVRTTSNKYDVILIGLSNPSDLSVNRFFTGEFFSLARQKLKPGGILSLWLPGSLTYLSRELIDLNAAIANGLQDTYKYVRVIPGDYNIFLASDEKGILRVSPAEISQKISQQEIKTNLLTPAYLDYRLDAKWSAWFKESLANTSGKANLDLAPFAVFEMMVFWNKQFSSGLAGLLASLQNINLTSVLLLILIITMMLFYLMRARPALARSNIAYAIATTGFFAMMMNLVLALSFQIFYGYLYHQIGMLLSVFMAGTAVGSFLIIRFMPDAKRCNGLFVRLEAAIIVCSYALAWVISAFFPRLEHPGIFFVAMFFIPGLLTGLQFPLASVIYLGQKKNVGEVSGWLYAADLFGGWLAGMLGGIFFLPILGFFNTCMVIVAFKCSSLFLLLYPFKGPKAN